MKNKFDKAAVTSLIVGILTNIINLISFCTILSTGRFSSALVCFFCSFSGILGAISGFKGNRIVLAIIGLVLNIIALLIAIGLLILSIVISANL